MEEHYSRQVNRGDQRLLTKAIDAINMLGLSESSEISGIARAVLRRYCSGERRPNFLKSATRRGLDVIIGEAERELQRDSDAVEARAADIPPAPAPDSDDPTELLRRLVDAVELVAVSVVILAER